MKKEESELIKMFSDVKVVLKSRGKKLSKDEFFKAVFEQITPESKETILKSLTPDEFYINEKLKHDPDFKKRVISLL